MQPDCNQHGATVTDCKADAAPPAHASSDGASRQWRRLRLTPAPVCPGATVTARVSITGLVALSNSTGAAAGPFSLTITTTSPIGQVVRRWGDVTAQHGTTTIVRLSRSTVQPRWRWAGGSSVAQFGGAQCEQPCRRRRVQGLVSGGAAMSDNNDMAGWRLRQRLAKQFASAMSGIACG